jgi:hypothetical protein
MLRWYVICGINAYFEKNGLNAEEDERRWALL